MHKAPVKRFADSMRGLPRGVTRRSGPFTYLGLGDTANALSALERATDAREMWPLTMEDYSPIRDPIRASARFRKLLERVGLAEYPVAHIR